MNNENELKLNIVEVKLLCDPRVIQETCSRIGIFNRKDKILYPSCYLYMTDTTTAICHFKEIILLTKENSFNNLSQSDILRRNAIISLLQKWNLIKIIDPSKIEPHDCFVYIVSYKEKGNITISHKINYRY
jgi:hypothetical protein